MSRWIAVLAGGGGTRFWPLSTPTRPKQLLPLAGTRPLLQQAVERVADIATPERILIITGRALLDVTRELLPSIPADNILVEPRAASTGPALTWATWVVHERDASATVLSLHADWFVPDAGAFCATAAYAMDVAERHDVLVTVGVQPSRPEVGYGYIQPGDPLEDDAFSVRTFVEKPERGRAEDLIRDGALWNSGLFAWTADRFMRETHAVAPEIAPHLACLERRDEAAFFASVTPIAIDHSHFERSSRIACVPGRFAWDDIGTWSALARARETDPAGNVLVGETFARDTRGCVVWADDAAVVVDGVEDLVVIQTAEVTLITTRERATQLKDLLDAMPADIRNRPT